MSFAPKPPPTSGAIARIRPFSRPSHSARSFRTSNGIWVETHTVSPPPSSGRASNVFVSMGTGARRWFTTRPRTTTSAPFSASSSQSEANASARFVPASGNRSGASFSSAASAPITGGRGSYSTPTTSTASTAWAWVSASTTATGSPTNRTTPLARTGRSNGPSTLLDGGWGSRSRSAAASTATTPGIAAATDASMPEIRACAIMERTNEARSAPSTGMLST